MARGQARRRLHVISHRSFYCWMVLIMMGFLLTYRSTIELALTLENHDLPINRSRTHMVCQEACSEAAVSPSRCIVRRSARWYATGKEAPNRREGPLTASFQVPNHRKLATILVLYPDKQQRLLTHGRGKNQSQTIR